MELNDEKYFSETSSETGWILLELEWHTSNNNKMKMWKDSGICSMTFIR